MDTISSAAGNLTKFFGAAVLVAGCAAWLGGCSSAASQMGKAFVSPQAAVESVVTAVRNNDQEQLKAILGPEAEDVIASGDPVNDAYNAATFVQAFDKQHRLVPGPNGEMILEVGPNNWPMPIPLVNTDGGWRFDTPAGIDEVLSRRIGRNELSTIQTCLAIVDAQRDYAEMDPRGDGSREYAQRFISTPGRRDGLFWPTAEGEPPSPLGDLIGQAVEMGYVSNSPASPASPRPFHGYLFRMLTSQGPDAPGGAMNYMAAGRMVGGFGVVAYPATYGNSGIKTFIVSDAGIVYEKDLGDDTHAEASAMQAFNPGPGWTKAAQ